MASTQLVDNGILWWFHAPKGIWTGTQLVMPWSATDGIWIGRFNSDGEQLETFRLEATTSPDDHHIASPGILPDGRILVAYTPHSNEIGMRVRISATPGQLDFGPPSIAATPQLGVISYPHLFRLSDESRWYLIYRDHNSGTVTGSPWYVTSDDEGETWSAPIRIVSDNGELPYTRVDSDGVSRIDVQITDGHPGTGFVADNSVYHFYYEAGQWSASDGTDIGPLPVAHTDMTLVWDGTGQKAWNWDVASGPNPAMVFSDVEDGQTNHRYIYARWTGSEWSTRFVVDSGGSLAGLSHYSPGINLDHADLQTVVLARWIGDGIEVERWSTTDGGLTWSTETITDDSVTPVWNFRPFVPRGGGPFQIVFTRGVYGPSFTNFDTTIQAWPPVDAPVPDPGGLPQVGTAVVNTEVTWLGCDLVTGRIIAEIPDMSGPVARALGAYTSPQVRIPIPRAGEASKPALPLLLQATETTRTMIVAVVNNTPMFGGIPLIRRGGTDGRLRLALVSIEGYLARRFVRDHVWTDEDESSVIAAGLIGDAGDIAGVGSGINLIIDTPSTGTLRDRTYHAKDHATVYERLRQLMGVRNGPEWTIDLDWTDASQTAVSKIFRVRKRIGVASDTPEAVFDTSATSVFSSQGASNARYEYAEDRTDGRYANYMVAYSVGEGEDQPQSDPAIDQVSLDAGAPIWERHWMPSSSITEISTLNDHAISDLDRLRDGVNIWSIESRWDTYPRYGVDWKLGDDVAWRLTGHRHPRPEGEPSSPGVVGQGRVIGFELNIETGIMQPILLRPGAEVIPE